jgi:hypothetical protein
MRLCVLQRILLETVSSVGKQAMKQLEAFHADIC